jgi:RNA binding exosome subunit
MSKVSGATGKDWYIETRVFVQATEDLDKVQVAVRNLLPEEVAASLVFEQNTLSGHYGNPIVFFTANITGENAVLSVLLNFASKLSCLDKETLDKDLDLHVEKSNLYLRFDKQSAFLGASIFSSYDPVCFKIHFKNKSSQQVIDAIREIGLLS